MEVILHLRVNAYSRLIFNPRIYTHLCVEYWRGWKFCLEQ